MSSALALASVTAILKGLLENGLAERGVSGLVGGDATVSTLPPDRITLGTEERPQLNLFLYQIAPNTGFRGMGLERPTVSQNGVPPLALDLYYLLTGYGAEEYQSEIVLGHGVQLLHERPFLAREELRAALKAASSTEAGRVAAPALAALAGSDLPEQVEQVKITPEYLTIEEQSRLWSSLQAKYRPSAAYKVSLVLLHRSVGAPGAKK